MGISSKVDVCMYQKYVGVTKGAPLGFILVIIFMVKLETKLVSKLNQYILKWNIYYVLTISFRKTELYKVLCLN